VAAKPDPSSNPPYLEQDDLRVYSLDEIACAIYLYCPGDKIVLLQGYFETYEGLGVIRTIDKINSKICIITTRSMLNNCINFLRNIQTEIAWKSSETDDHAANEIFKN
jgi:hypothetical protein